MTPRTLVYGLSLMVATVFASAVSAEERIIEAREVVAIQFEPEDEITGRYDWGASVMLDEDGRYRMWWIRLGGANQKRFPYAAVLPDGERFEFTYPDRGDRVYHAVSRDGRNWRIAGEEFTGPSREFGPDALGPLMVLGPAESEHERMHIGCPSVIKVEGTYYLYYEAACEFVVTRGADGRIAVGNEFHNQVFVATSSDGRTWHKHPDDRSPQPIVPAPAANKQLGRQRYGLGQPSVCFRDGRFIMHYVDSCTAPGDWIVRVEADNPWFRDARVFRRSLRPASEGPVPAGAVARFAQTDVKYLDDAFYLLRPAYGTGQLGLLSSRNGVFTADADVRHPAEVFPRIDVPDPRGDAYRERLYPRFLTDPQGAICVENGRVVLYYGSGAGFKEKAHTWDLRRAEIPVESLRTISR